MKGVYIIGKLESVGELAALGPNFAKAVAFLTSHDLATLPAGRNAIDGDEVWANVDEIELMSPAEKRPELHRKYFDLQIPLACEETFGLARFDERSEGSFDGTKDIGFYTQPVELVTLRPGEFAVFYPGTCLHEPGCSLTGPRAQRKIIVKIRA